MNGYLRYNGYKQFLSPYQNRLRYLINYLSSGGTFTFSTSAGNAIIVNQGSGSTTYDGLCYSGNPVVIGAGNELTFSTPNSNEYVYQSNITTGISETQAVATTVTGSQGTFDWCCVLASTKRLSSADLTLLASNPYAIVECGLGKTGHGLSIVQADITALYVPTTGQGAYLQNIMTALGSNIVSGGSFESGLIGFVADSGTVVQSTDFSSSGTYSMKITTGTTADDVHSNAWATVSANTTYLVKAKVYLPTGYSAASAPYIIFKYYNLSTSSIVQYASTSLLDQWQEISIIVKFDTDVSGFIYFNNNDTVGGDTYYVDELTCQTLEAITIPSYTIDLYNNANLNQKGVQTLPLVIDATGRVMDIDYTKLYFTSLKKETIPTRTRTSNLTIDITPRELPITFMSTVTAGTVTLNANGTVTASSGSVAIDTTTVAVDTRSVITIDGISIDGITTVNASGSKFELHDYKEE